MARSFLLGISSISRIRLRMLLVAKKSDFGMGLSMCAPCCDVCIITAFGRTVNCYLLVLFLNNRPHKTLKPHAWNRVISLSPKIVGINQSHNHITGRAQTRLIRMIKPTTVTADPMKFIIF